MSPIDLRAIAEDRSLCLGAPVRKALLELAAIKTYVQREMTRIDEEIKGYKKDGGSCATCDRSYEDCMWTGRCWTPSRELTARRSAFKEISKHFKP